MSQQNSEQSKNSTSNLQKTTRFVSVPQVFQYENSRQYQNEQFLLDDIQQVHLINPTSIQKKSIFNNKMQEPKDIKINSKSQPMQIQNLKQHGKYVSKNNQQQKIDPQIAALDEQFQRIQKMVEKRQQQNKTGSPQKVLEAIKERQYKRFSQRGINLQSILKVAPQVQSKSGRKTFDVQQITLIKQKTEKIAEEINNNKKKQQVNNNVNIQKSNSIQNQQKQEEKTNSQQIQQKMNLAKKKKERLTLGLYQIMGLMQKVQQKEQNLQNTGNTRKKRQNRLTIDINSIAKMFQNEAGLNKKSQKLRQQQKLSNSIILEDDNQNQITPLKPQQFYPINEKQQLQLSQQQLNRLLADKYFSQIDLRIQNLKKENARLQQLKQNLLRQKKMIQQPSFKINPEQLQNAKNLNEQYQQQTKRLQGKINIEKYNESMKIINSFNYSLQMQIYKFQIDINSNLKEFQTFFAKFKIGPCLVKLRRVIQNKNIQARIKTLVVPSQSQTQGLFDSSTLSQLIYLFITQKLNNEKTLLQVIFGISKFYQMIKQLQAQLQQLMEFLNLSDFELNSTQDYLSFKYHFTIKNCYNIQISLLDILQSKTRKNFVTIYNKRKKVYMQLPSNYRPYEKSLLWNEIDFIQQTFSVFDK